MTTDPSQDLDRRLEAILMVLDEPQPVIALATALGAPVPAVRQTIERLVADFDGTAPGSVRRGFELREAPEEGVDGVAGRVRQAEGVGGDADAAERVA